MKRRFLNRYGFMSLVEIVVVLAIAAICYAIIRPSYLKQTERSRLKEGIHQVYNLKKAMEQFMINCRGYPWVPAKTTLRNVIDYQLPGASRPKIYPDEVDCDATTLEEILPGILECNPADPTHKTCTPQKVEPCDYTDIGCVRSKGSLNAFNQAFVKAPAGNPVSANCATNYGWGFTLVPTAKVYQEPTAVYCGAVGFHGGYAMIVVDSENQGTADPDGPYGATLPNPCPCGAWCYESLSGSSGCCNGCDTKGGPGNTFRYTLRY